MAAHPALLERVREALAQVPRVKEKKMFSGLTFMVDGKMCVSVGDERIMCRIDPEIHEDAVKRKAARTMEMKGRAYRGYVHVGVEGLKTKKDLDYWIGLALDFNGRAKAAPKRKRAQPER